VDNRQSGIRRIALFGDACRPKSGAGFTGTMMILAGLTDPEPQ
jgi:hypothetical protein